VEGVNYCRYCGRKIDYERGTYCKHCGKPID
jgi:predicted amidophosphoribosyltransferase